MKNPKAVHLPLLHGFLTLALVHHMGSSSPTIGDAIGDALYEWTDIGKGWEELKKNPEEFAEFVLNYLEQTGNAPMNRDATKKVIVQAVKKSAKVLDKMIPTVESLMHLKATSKAVAGDADDPLQILRNAGIEVEPELEEFRQFLAEISGKKVEPKGSKARKGVEGGIPPEVLSIAKALEFSDFSEKAMKKAEKELLKMIDRFIEEEDAAALFHAVKLLRLVQKGDVEGIKRFGG